jgi:hypothetical protein
VSARVAALVVALLAIALVLAQDLYPRSALYHTWQYALALAIALLVVLSYANRARRGADGPVGKRLAWAMLGAAGVAAAGIGSGLLGPDSATVIGTPGTVNPIPALGAAAFFAPADGAAIERGSGGVTLRRRGAGEIALAGGARRVLGESLVYLEPRPAAYVEAYDERGAHLTVTQPTSSAFLSPVLLFRDRQRIGAVSVPLDTFATPARKRVVRALYFTPAELAQFQHVGGAAPGDRPALVVTVADDAGRPLGITLVPSGRETAVAGIRIRATLGSYPALTIAAAPPTWALGGGIALFALGLVWAGFALREGAAALGEPTAGEPTAGEPATGEPAASAS